jgi:hypothetical protein
VRDDACAIGEGSERLDAQVYPCFLTRRWQGVHGHIRTRNGDVPPIRLFRDRDGFWRPLDGTNEWRSTQSW